MAEKEHKEDYITEKSFALALSSVFLMAGLSLFAIAREFFPLFLQNGLAPMPQPLFSYSYHISWAFFLLSGLLSFTSILGHWNKDRAELATKICPSWEDRELSRTYLSRVLAFIAFSATLFAVFFTLVKIAGYFVNIPTTGLLFFEEYAPNELLILPFLAILSCILVITPFVYKFGRLREKKN